MFNKKIFREAALFVVANINLKSQNVSEIPLHSLFRCINSSIHKELEKLFEFICDITSKKDNSLSHFIVMTKKVTNRLISSFELFNWIRNTNQEDIKLYTIQILKIWK